MTTEELSARAKRLAELPDRLGWSNFEHRPHMQASHGARKPCDTLSPRAGGNYTPGAARRAGREGSHQRQVSTALSSEARINILERAMGIDLDGDGDIGVGHVGPLSAPGAPAAADEPLKARPDILRTSPLRVRTPVEEAEPASTGVLLSPDFHIHHRRLALMLRHHLSPSQRAIIEATEAEAAAARAVAAERAKLYSSAERAKAAAAAKAGEGGAKAPQRKNLTSFLKEEAARKAENVKERESSLLAKQRAEKREREYRRREANMTNDTDENAKASRARRHCREQVMRGMNKQQERLAALRSLQQR
jgi:hypothetical protein